MLPVGKSPWFKYRCLAKPKGSAGRGTDFMFPSAFQRHSIPSVL
jgi:hypothetical protein